MKMTAEFPSDDTPATKSIRLKITLDEGDTIRLGAILDPEDAEEPKWTSSNKKVATVSSSGKVKAISEGTATIKCRSGGKTLKIKLVVEAA
ncbi:MAG: Ig-like domain-containing protein [Bacteroides sp.]|nr:Ig-like domain-containing protein [Roseburia sp.]MCM1462468.1 Ig-like domain-containing protein [Bacteroides sp.]